MLRSIAPLLYWVGILSLGCQGDLLQTANAQVKADELSFAMPPGERFSVTEILQGRDGFLWVSSTIGLLRYDGYEFESFRHTSGDSSSLVNNYINSNALVEDDQGHLWIGTRGGLSRLDPATNMFTNYYHDPARPASLSHNWIRHVLLSRTGEIWVGTNDGISRYEPQTDGFSHYKHDPDDVNSVDSPMGMSLAEDASGYIWIGTDRGLNRLDPADGSVDRFSLPTEAKVWSLMIDSNDQVWAGTEQGVVFKYNPAGHFDKFDLFADFDIEDRTGFVIDIYEDNVGNIWVGTWNGGLFIYHVETDTWTRAMHRREDLHSLPENSVSDFYKDRSGKMWIGTWSGLTFVQPERRFDHLDLNRLSITSATSVDVDAAENIWVSTAGGGVWWQNGETGEEVVLHQDAPEPYKISSNRVMSVLTDRSGRIWMGTSGAGINRYDPKTSVMSHYYHNPSDTTSLPSNLVYKIFQDRSERIWIGTIDAGLALWDEATDTFSTYAPDSTNVHSIASNEVVTIFQGKDGRIWVGTIGGGLHEILIKDDTPLSSETRFGRYQYPDSSAITSNDVIAINQDEAGNLWVGTLGGGLNKILAGTGRFIHYGTEDGLPDDIVACMLPDNKGYVWLSTLKGLSRFDPVKEVFTNYTIADGLASTTFYMDGCKSSPSGEFYFTNTAGVTVFDPDSITDNLTPPAIALTEVMLFNKPLAMDSAATHKRLLKLSHDHNFLSFTFTALDFTLPEKNRYRYKLEGLDENWVEAGTKRNADYPNLQPGAYTLQVQAANNDGIWSQSTALIHLEITSPFWQTLWFQFFILVFAGIVAWAVYDTRKQKRLELDRVRQQIADDLHDDIGGNLSALVMFLKRISTATGLNLNEQASARLYLSSVNRMMADLRDAIWMADAEDDSLGEVVLRLEQTAYKLIQGTRLNIERENIVEDTKTEFSLRRHFYLVYKEVLHNIAQHAEATEVSIRFIQKKKQFQVEVHDNGKGFNINTVKKGRGLSSILRRAEQWHIEFNLDSAPGKGTAVLLVIEI